MIYTVLVAYILGRLFIPYNNVGEEFKHILNDFRVKMWDKCDGKHIKSTWQLSISTGYDLVYNNKNIIGLCHPRLFGFDITVSKEYWDIASDANKKQLLYHELLHCYLNLEHKRDTIMDEYTIPFSDNEIESQLDAIIGEACEH